MAVYAIGDVQGCYGELRALLDAIHFDSANDRLWFAGDLVNRGPKSLEVLRFIRELGDTAVVVLGNHDLHLLAVWLGRHRHFSRNDTLDAILSAPDREELLEWLRHRPLLHHDAILNWTMVHAGLAPQWDLATARALANEVETALRGEAFPEFVAHMYGNEPHRWDEALTGWERLRFAVNCFTRLRYCHRDGRLDLSHKAAPAAGNELVPWFDMERRHDHETRVVFGHWSTLGLYRGANVLAIDTGCLWGGTLTAARLDVRGEPTVGVPCQCARQPGED